MNKKIFYVVGVISIGIFVASKFNQGQKKIDVSSIDEIAPIVVLKAFEALNKQVDKHEEIITIECWGTKLKQVNCSGLGNILHSASFMTEREMPHLEIKGLRDFDGKLKVATLSGVPNKLKPTERNELVTLFDKPMPR